MTDITAIRNAIATKLATISGVNVYARLPGTVVAPALVVRRRSTTYDTTMAGDSDDNQFGIMVFVQFGEDDSAQQNLDSYIATGVIKHALEADPTLGGVVAFSAITTVGEDQLMMYAGVQYLTAELVLQVG